MSRIGCILGVNSRDKPTEKNWSNRKFTEYISFNGWLNRKPEDLSLIFPASFQELEDFVDGSNLEVFKCSDKKAINYKASQSGRKTANKHTG